MPGSMRACVQRSIRSHCHAAAIRQELNMTTVPSFVLRTAYNARLLPYWEARARHVPFNTSTSAWHPQRPTAVLRA